MQCIKPNNTYFTNFIHLFNKFDVEAAIANVCLIHFLLLNVLRVQVPDNSDDINSVLNTVSVINR